MTKNGYVMAKKRLKVKTKEVRMGDKKKDKVQYKKAYKQIMAAKIVIVKNIMWKRNIDDLDVEMKRKKSHAKWKRN